MCELAISGARGCARVCMTREITCAPKMWPNKKETLSTSVVMTAPSTPKDCTSSCTAHKQCEIRGQFFYSCQSQSILHKTNQQQQQQQFISTQFDRYTVKHVHIWQYSGWNNRSNIDRYTVKHVHIWQYSGWNNRSNIDRYTVKRVHI